MMRVMYIMMMIVIYDDDEYNDDLCACIRVVHFSGSLALICELYEYVYACVTCRTYSQLIRHSFRLSEIFSLKRGSSVLDLQNSCFWPLNLKFKSPMHPQHRENSLEQQHGNKQQDFNNLWQRVLKSNMHNFLHFSFISHNSYTTQRKVFYL